MHQAHHSADVRMLLYVNGSTLPIAQLGPDFIILRTPTDHPPTDADIYLSIDGHERRWTVWLPDGVSASTRRTKIAPLVN